MKICLIAALRCIHNLSSWEFKAWKRFSRAISDFLYLKAEMCVRMKLLVWRELLFILRICGKKNSSNHKVWDFATAFRVRTLLGTFQKRTPELDSNPRPLRNLCSALPTELLSHLGAGHIVSPYYTCETEEYKWTHESSYLPTFISRETSSSVWSVN